MPCSVRLLKTTPASFDFYDFDEYGRLVTTAAKVDVMTLLIVSRRRCRSSRRRDAGASVDRCR